MKGTTVQLIEKVEVSKDPFGHPVYEEHMIDVEDVLVGQPSTDDITDTLNLYGKRIEFVLGIPKGDRHNWIDAEVMIWGRRYRTIGFPQTGIQENIPLRWGSNVKVEAYG